MHGVLIDLMRNDFPSWSSVNLEPCFVGLAAWRTYEKAAA